LVAYFSSHNPDPWQKVMDDVEAQMLADGSMSMDYEPFFHRLKELADAFSVISTKGIKERPSIGDAFMSGKETTVLGWRSHKDMACAVCGSKENISIIKNPENELKTWVVCENHK
jgi:hypothetical protein